MVGITKIPVKFRVPKTRLLEFQARTHRRLRLAGALGLPAAKNQR
jgi:hypothetical protein